MFGGFKIILYFCGGNRSKGYKYAGSNNIDEVVWYDNNSGSKTHPIGHSGSCRVDRGGSWNCALRLAAALRTASSTCLRAAKAFSVSV